MSAQSTGLCDVVYCVFCQPFATHVRRSQAQGTGTASWRGRMETQTAMAEFPACFLSGTQCKGAELLRRGDRGQSLARSPRASVAGLLDGAPLHQQVIDNKKTMHKAPKIDKRSTKSQFCAVRAPLEHGFLVKTCLVYRLFCPHLTSYPDGR